MGNRRTVGLVTFCLDRFRNTTSIMADEEAAAAPVKKEFGQQADMSNPTPFPSSVPSTPPTEGGEAPVAAQIIEALESVVEESEPAVEAAPPAPAEEAAPPAA